MQQSNIQKVERQQFVHPNIQTFASPSITPSNNYRSNLNQTKDLNTSNIQGRKIDSPQLRVVKPADPERPQTAHLQQLNNLKRDDFLQLYNQANQFNQTNKEIQKKQFDFNIKNPRANVTIQYDDKVPQQPQRGHTKGSKSMGVTHKKRQQSQSVPKHQPSASIVNTQAQPLINLHIQNAKQAQMARSKPKKVDTSKYSSVPAQNTGGKSKSKNGRYKNLGSKKNILKLSKHLLNQSNVQPKHDIFSFDNKENQSINYNEFSPSRIMGRKNQNNFLDSDSSLSSPKLMQDQSAITNQLGKSYFMDKSTLLKHLSPDRSQRAQSTSNKYHQPSQQPQVVTSDRERSREPINYRSHATTISNLIPQPQMQLEPRALDQSKNLKRAGTSNSNKINLKGVDRLIKENLKKIKNKEDEEVTKRFLEEYRQKLKKAELSQRNQEVRKINASKIIYNHKHKNSQVNNLLQQKVAYKKQRSKSCMNKTDNIFGGLPRSKERQPIQEQQPQPKPDKKEKKREKSFVLEMKELKKQIDEEIRRELIAGKLEVPTTTHKRTNLTTINAKREPHSNKKEFLNMSAVDVKVLKNNSKGDIIFHQQKRRKSKSRDAGQGGNKNISMKIKKFIERKKKLQTAAKSLEQTIENEKQLKIQENLKNLSKFVKTHLRQQSYNFSYKRPQLNKELSDKQIQEPIIKKLKPHFPKQPKSKKNSKERVSGQYFKFDNETVFQRFHEDQQTPLKLDEHTRDNDVSRDFYEDYNRIFYPQQKANESRTGYQSISIEISPKGKSGKKRGRKVKDDSSESSNQLTAIKNKPVSVLVKPNKEPTLIPPQSEIATLDKNMTKSNLSLKAPSTDQKRQSVGTRSPSTRDFQRKMRDLMYRYAPQQSNVSDTKLLIKLHSAAITIQQQLRKHLLKRGFYEDSEANSPMYVDSEEEEEEHYDEYPTKQLIAQSSPLRMKGVGQPKYKENAGQNKFYAEDSDVEKVIVCSVISSARPEEESLQNTQKYVPLRQKKKGVSQGSSVAQSGFNTAIKNEVPSRLEQEDQRKKFIPSLNLDKIVPTKQQVLQEESKRDSNTNRSIFKRDSFQEYKATHPVHIPGDYPELLKQKEEAIRLKENEQQLLTEMYRQKKVSPRTYNVKRQDLERWVSKEREEVKKTKISYEEESQKILQMMNDAQKNSEHMKQMLFADKPNSGRRDYTDRQPIVSQRTSRSQSTLLDMINNNKSSDKEQEERKKKEEQDRVMAEKKVKEDRERREQEQKRQADERALQERVKREQDEKDRQERERKDRELRERQERERQENERREREEKQRQERQKQEEERKRKEQEQRERERQLQLEKQEQVRIDNLRKQLEAQQQQQKLDEIRQQEAERRKMEEEAAKAKREQEIAQQKAEQLQREQEEAQRREALRLQREEEDRKRKEDQRKQDEAQRKLEQQRVEEARRVEDEKRAEQLRVAETKRVEEQKKQEELRKQEEIKRQAELKKAEELKRQQEEMQRKEEERLKAEEEERKRKEEQEKLEAARAEAKKLEEQTLRQQRELELQDQKSKSRYKEPEEDLLSEPGFDDSDYSPQPLIGKAKEVLNTSDNEDPTTSHQKGLSRTRSSQYLKDTRTEEFKIQSLSSESSKQEDVKIEEEQELDSAQRRQLKDGIHDESDEDVGSQLQEDIKKPDFFTNNFDHAQVEDVINQTKKRSTEDETNQSHILIQGDTSSLEEEVSHHRGQRSQQQVIPSEYHGAPVSPASQEGNHDFRIQTGSQSLESTLSDNENLKRVIHDVVADSQVPENSPTTPNDLEQQVDLITDDIFRSLLTEMRVELDLLLLSDPRNLYPHGHQPNNFSESGRFLIFERRGIKTDLFAIERYVEEILDEVLRERNRFLSNIQSAISKNPREVLNQLQNSEIGSYEHFEVNYPAVLPLDLYLKLEKRRKENREREQQENQNPGNADRNFLAECEHIHNKVLFDCINDSLLQFKQPSWTQLYRPYGKDGNPLPWSRQNRRLKPIEDFTIEEMFEIVKHDLFRWAIMQAGTLPRREFVLGGIFDDELFAEIREKKLATLLAREMIENEPKWLNYEFEEAQVKIDIGDMILEQLVTETITILNEKIGHKMF